MKNFILLLEKFCNGFIHMMVNNAEVWQTLNFDPNIYQNFRHEHRINLFFTVKIRLIKDCILIKDLPGQHLILSMLGIIFDNLTHIIHQCFHSILVVWFEYCLDCLTLGRSLYYTILGPISNPDTISYVTPSLLTISVDPGLSIFDMKK